MQGYVEVLENILTLIKKLTPHFGNGVFFVFTWKTAIILKFEIMGNEGTPNLSLFKPYTRQLC